MRIRRYGFPPVPDFGGTAHARRGSTMETSIGDLLSWYHWLRLEDMTTGYLITSCIGEAGKLLLVQTYSPRLFQQGTLPGPRTFSNHVSSLADPAPI